MRDVFQSLIPDTLEGFYLMTPGDQDEGQMERDLSYEQHQDLAVRLATIETLVQVNAQCTRRLEVRLLGSDDNPDSGIIADHSRRIRRLEDSQLRFIAIASAGLILLNLFQKKLMAILGL